MGFSINDIQITTEYESVNNAIKHTTFNIKVKERSLYVSLVKHRMKFPLAEELSSCNRCFISLIYLESMTFS